MGLFIPVLIILLIAGALGFISTTLFSIVTLGFLPSGLEMLYNTNVRSSTIPVIGKIVEVILNIGVSAFVNIVDFLVWFIAWIPGLNIIIDFVYRSPDLAERMLPFIFGGLGGHRNFITHSVLNPIFLIFIGITYLLIKNISSEVIANVIKVLFVIIGLTFVCHLLADTMPMGWRGTANIKVYLFIPLFSLSPFFSKVWLIINAGLSAMAIFKIASEE